jgi:multiple sugar transport system permease protein
VASAVSVTAPGPLTRVRRWASGFRERETWVAYAFVFPWLLGFVVFTAGPMVASAYLSLTDYSVIQPTTYVGLENYRFIWEDLKVPDSDIRIALHNTAVFALMSVPLTMIVALGLAMILARVRWGGGFFRTVFYLPNITPPVAVAILYLLLFNGSVGLVNRGLDLIGIPGPFWTTDPSWVKPGLVLMNVWSVGGTMVIYLAALKSVPQHLYEAASMDGASAWRRFRDITLPMISPALFFTLIIQTIYAFTYFTEAYTAFFGAGTNQTDAAFFYAIYLFQEAFVNFHMGFASALAWLLFVVIMVITFVQVKVGNRFVFYQGERR